MEKLPGHQNEEREGERQEKVSVHARSLRHRVKPAGVEGMAAREASQHEPGAAERSMALNGLLRIHGATWLEAAYVAEQGRERQAVKTQDSRAECGRPESPERTR